MRGHYLHARTNRGPGRRKRSVARLATARANAIAAAIADSACAICGESYGAAHPELRGTFRWRLEAELGPPSPQDSGCLVEELWPAAIAYAVTFATDRIERRGHRPPVVNLFDCIHERSLTDHFAHLRSTLI